MEPLQPSAYAPYRDPRDYILSWTDTIWIDRAIGRLARALRDRHPRPYRLWRDLRLRLRDLELGAEIRGLPERRRRARRGRGVGAARPERLHQLAPRAQDRHPYRLLDLWPADRARLHLPHRRALPGAGQPHRRGMAGARRVRGARDAWARSLQGRRRAGRAQPGDRPRHRPPHPRAAPSRAGSPTPCAWASPAPGRRAHREVCEMVVDVFRGRLEPAALRPRAAIRERADRVPRRADAPRAEPHAVPAGASSTCSRPSRTAQVEIRDIAVGELARARPARGGDLGAARHLFGRADLRAGDRHGRSTCSARRISSCTTAASCASGASSTRSPCSRRSWRHAARCRRRDAGLSRADAGGRGAGTRCRARSCRRRSQGRPGSRRRRCRTCSHGPSRARRARPAGGRDGGRG